MSGSGRYTHGHHDSVLRSHRWRTAENSAGYLLGHLRPGDRLLDVGCGPGTITADLAARVAPGQVVAIDAEAAVLKEAEAAVAAHPALSPAAVELRVGDVSALDDADGSFDVVHAHQVLHHVTDPVAALAEMRRVCRPGGLVAARDADYGAMVWHPDIPELHDWRDLFRRLARANGAEPDAGRRLLQWAQAAGFSDVQPSASVWCFATAEDRSWWSGTWAERVTASAYAEQAAAAGVGRDQLEAMAAGWHRWGQQPEGWFVLVHGEVLCRA